MRDVYLSNAFERIAAYAVSHGELITRNGCQLDIYPLGASENELLSQKLDEQKQQFLSQVKSLVETYVEKEAPLLRILPKDIQDALKKSVSLSLSPLEHSLQCLSFCDVRTEILRAWLDSQTSSTPSSNETHPTDSQSTGCDESVADGDEQDTELGDHYPALRAFSRTLTDHYLRVVADFGMPYWAERILKTAAQNEIKRRGLS